MVIALYVIALAMIVGGAAAAVQGYGIVLNERGWSMLIAGTVAAAGGCVLLGVAVVATRLRGIERELTRLRERSGRLENLSAVPPPPPVATSPTQDGSARPAPAFAGEEGGRSSPASADEKTETTKAESAEIAVLKAADVIPEPAPALAPAAPATAEGPMAPDEKPAESRTVVGTYSSGGNTYVMFADGSIEADTPSGLFRFQNLDELKEFIAAGGEEGTPPPRAA